MALSDDEQRRLDALEAAWAAEDPGFASALRGRPHITFRRRSAGLGLIGLLAGMALLVLGISTFFVISLVGYVLMLLGALAFVGSIQRVEAPAPTRLAPRQQLNNQAFVDMMEQQWRRAHPGQHHPTKDRRAEEQHHREEH